MQPRSQGLFSSRRREEERPWERGCHAKKMRDICLLFLFSFPCPQILTQNFTENDNINIFSEKQSYRLLSPDVRVDLRYLANTLSGNLKIYSESEKKPM